MTALDTLPPLAAHFAAMADAAVALGVALERRLAACRKRHDLEQDRKKKAKKPGKGGGHWFNWSEYSVSSSQTIGFNPEPGSAKTGSGE